MPWWGWVLIGLALVLLGWAFYAFTRLMIKLADSYVELNAARNAYFLSLHRKRD
jgi:hypothetical protein